MRCVICGKPASMLKATGHVSGLLQVIVTEWSAMCKKCSTEQERKATIKRLFGRP